MIYFSRSYLEYLGGRFLVVTMACCTFCAYAQSSNFDPGQVARTLGAEGNQRGAQAPQQVQANPSYYYPPGYTANPPATTYYNSGTALPSQSRSVLASAPANDPSKVVVDQATSGPQFAIAPTDPILTQGQTIGAQATALTQTYQGCQPLAVGQPNSQTFTTKTCNVTETSAVATCTQQLLVTCPSTTAPLTMSVISKPSDMEWQYTFPQLTYGHAPTWSGNCTLYDRVTTFTIPDVAQVNQFTLAQAIFDDYLYVAINGHAVFDGPSGGNMLAINNGRVQYDTNGATGGCDLGTEWTQAPNVNVKPYLVSGTNTIHTINEVSGNGNGYLEFTVSQYPDCSANDQWVQSCPGTAPIASCTLESSVCSDGPSTRRINGVPQTRDCWTYMQTYLCASPQQQSLDACNRLLSQGCQQTASTCVSHDGTGACTQYQQTYRCPAAAAAPGSVTLCGSDLYCPNGNCTTDVSTAAAQPATITQLAQASSWLQAAQDAASDNTNNNGTISFFGGKSMECKDAAFGFQNCCAATGWGTGIGLTQCNAQEQTLGLAREAGETHEVGTYTTGSFVTKTRYEVDCVFSSMLSRIIQEQGRAQLGIAWGSAQSPNCAALTQAQLETIDFNKIDFSEFYAKAEAQANTAMANIPSNTAIQQQLQQQIQYMIQHPGATNGASSTSGP